MFNLLNECAALRNVFKGTENPRVGGSIPSLGTSNIKGLAIMANPFYFGWLHIGCRWLQI